MNQISYKTYQDSFLEGIVDVWNESLIHDVINIERFKALVILDENFNPELLNVALVDEKVVGFVLGIKRKFPYLERGLEPDRGWISVICVNPDYQKQGIGTHLVSIIEDKLKGLNTKEITLCAYSPNYFFPGIDVRYKDAVTFFEKLGYVLKSTAVSMQRSLFDHTLSLETKQQMSNLKKEGYSIIQYNDQYMVSLLKFLETEFDAGWKRNALIAMQKEEAVNTILLCIDKNNHIVGYCMRKIDGSDSRFGPIGVAKSMRSKGLGGVLLETMMVEARKRNINYLYFLWTSGAAIRFYERHGFAIYRSYQLYRKEM